MAGMLHQMSANKGLVKFVSAKSTPKNATNVVYKPPKKKAKDKKKPVVTKSFRTAFNKLTPSKEIRFELSPGLETSTSVASRTSVQYLDNIAQGTQLNQRLRNIVHISYLHLKGTLQNNSNTKTKALRIMVFREINYGTINPAVLASLWKATGSALVYAPTGTSSDQRWPLNKEICYPIFDKTVTIKPESEGMKVLDYKIKINRLVRFPANNSAVSVPYHGRLMLVFALSDCDDATTTTTMQLSVAGRIFFKDYYKTR